MAASIDYEPGSVPPARPSTAVAVFRYRADAPKFADRYEHLPNVRFLGCVYREGAQPPTARFRYVFGDPTADPEDPQRIEGCFPIDAAGPRVVMNDDRLVVRIFRDDGYSEILFDGFKSPCQVDLDAETEAATFLAAGTPVREFDEPVGYSLFRPADQPLEPVAGTPVNAPARFNPDGKPNASPLPDYDRGDGSTFPEYRGVSYPHFLGPVWPANRINGASLRMWTLGMAARHLVGAWSLLDPSTGGRWTNCDQFGSLDDVLQVLQPSDPDGTGPIDASNGTTFVKAGINVVDYDATGKGWPTALEEIIAPHGFAMCWRLSDATPKAGAEWGDPRWNLAIYHRDDNANLKPLLLPPAGTDLDPAAVNVGALAVSRDVHDLANKVYVDASPVRFEASILLAPGFTISAGDASSLDDYVADGPNFDVNRDEYRVFVADECGEGHWSHKVDDFVADPPTLSAILQSELTPAAKFVVRRRPGVNAILKRGPDGEALKAQLHVARLSSMDSQFWRPGLWQDGVGTWQLVDSSEWSLLDDRLGIRINCSDPNSFKIGQPSDPAAPFPSGKLTIVESLAASIGDKSQGFMFRLTCCIDGDSDFGMIASRRSASPTKFSVARRIDARDRYRMWIQSQFSALKPAGVRKDVAVVDDTKEAKSYASSARRHLEFGSMAGSATIPRLSTAYQVGDKISDVRGREISLRTNLGAETGESPVYPSVTGISWDCDGRQATTLELDDHVAMPPIPHRRKRR